MISNITHSRESAHGAGVYKIQIYLDNSIYPINIIVSYAPTGNCQTMAMRTFSNLLFRNLSNEEFIQIFRYIYSNCGKRILLLDINSFNHKYIKALGLTKEELFFDKPYRSTNNSRMRMLMINLMKL